MFKVSLMDLLGYSSGIKEILRGNNGTNAVALINELPVGKTQKIFGFALGNKNIHVIAPTRDVLQTLFDVISKAIPQDHYDYSIRVTEDNKVRTISKRGHPSISIKKLKDEMTAGGGKFQRVFYEMLTTNDFEITNSEFEGPMIKCDDEALLRRIFMLLSGLFPFAETTKETRKVGIECNFEIETYEVRREQKRKGKLVCNIILDGKQVGSKSNSFIL
jgi:hypothetical protein